MIRAGGHTIQMRRIFGLFKNMSKPRVTIFIYPEGEKVNLPAVQSLINEAKGKESMLTKTFEENSDIVNKIESNGVHMIQPKVGQILLDSINDSGLQNLNIFGICEKQLACLSCRINFKHGYENTPKIEVDEEDAFDSLLENYRDGETRMSCQIIVDEKMDGCVIEVPGSAFGMFDHDHDDRL